MVLDYSMMQWVLSIVVGVSLSRFINTIALIGGKKDQVKFDFMTREECDRIRSKSAGAHSQAHPWNTDYEAMCLKSVIKKMSKTISKKQNRIQTQCGNLNVVGKVGITPTQHGNRLQGKSRRSVPYKTKNNKHSNQ